MRYRVRLAGLLSCCEELERASAKLRLEAEELDIVIRQLSELDYLEGVLAKLSLDRRNLEEETRLTLVMAQAARRCHSTYKSTEEQIIEDLDCPRHILLDGGDAASGNVFMYDTPVLTHSSTEARTVGAVDWHTDMTDYAAVLAALEITVTLSDLGGDKRYGNH